MITVGNNFVQRILDITDGRLRTSYFHSLLSGAELRPGRSCAEFVIRFTDGSVISCDELTVSGSEKKNGNLYISFEEYDGLSVCVRFFTDHNPYVIGKQIDFKDKRERNVDRVIIECFDLREAVETFSAPDGISGNELSGYHSALGQPFFADGFFFGSEFPATENLIKDGVGRIVYYSGKPAKGVFTSPVCITGTGSSADFYDVRSAFFDYIESIAQPVDFRLQYNSWYDGMLEITEEGIINTFSEVAREFSRHGIPMPDAFTVDDGWNDYKAPFWSFNKKFPTELESVVALTAEKGSSLGLWLGPRGGYNAQTASFAKRIQRNGLGAYNRNSHDICVADKTYRENLEKFLTETLTRLDLSYLKLDGFCLKPCRKKGHNHPVGGKNDMYMFTEMWEGWIEVFKSLRESRASQGKSLWINMTCYVNPSPWWLQFVNSVWLQNSSDIDFSTAYMHQSQADSEITYRDSRYYEFLVNRHFVFPLCHIYNHEPIYGKSAKVSYSDGEFEKYLMFNACRGQSLNELHLSCSMMTPAKWEILAEVLKWQRANYEILRNAVFVGDNPEKGNVYAYCSFDADGRRIAAVRNPSDRELKYILRLDSSIGCMKNNEKLNVKCVFGDAFDENATCASGDKIELTLKPFDILVLSFDKR